MKFCIKFSEVHTTGKYIRSKDKIIMYGYYCKDVLFPVLLLNTFVYAAAHELRLLLLRTGL
jgi:hypothetical protein